VLIESRKTAKARQMILPRAMPIVGMVFLFEVVANDADAQSDDR
jgi:hypothetical protein